MKILPWPHAVIHPALNLCFSSPVQRKGIWPFQLKWPATPSKTDLETIFYRKFILRTVSTSPWQNWSWEKFSSIFRSEHFHFYCFTTFILIIMSQHNTYINFSEPDTIKKYFIRKSNLVTIHNRVSVAFVLQYPILKTFFPFLTTRVLSSWKLDTGNTSNARLQNRNTCSY